MGDCCEVSSEFQGTEKEPKDYFVTTIITKTKKLDKGEPYIKQCNDFLAYVLSAFVGDAMSVQRGSIKAQELRSPVYLFGAGKIGEEVFKHMKAAGITPVGFVDNDIYKQGTRKCGLTVFSPEVLNKESTVVISATDEDAIEDSLKEKEFKLIKFSDLII